MFDEETLELILNNTEVRQVPYCYKYAVINAVEQVLEDKEKRDNARLQSEYVQISTK